MAEKKKGGRKERRNKGFNWKWRCTQYSWCGVFRRTLLKNQDTYFLILALFLHSCVSFKILPLPLIKDSVLVSPFPQKHGREILVVLTFKGLCGDCRRLQAWKCLEKINLAIECITIKLIMNNNSFHFFILPKWSLTIFSPVSGR